MFFYVLGERDDLFHGFYGPCFIKFREYLVIVLAINELNIDRYKSFPDEEIIENFHDFIKISVNILNKISSFHDFMA